MIRSFYSTLCLRWSVLPPSSGFVPSETNRAPNNPHTLEPMEAAIQKTNETKQTTQNTSLTTTSDGIPRETPTGLGRATWRGVQRIKHDD